MNSVNEMCRTLYRVKESDVGWHFKSSWEGREKNSCGYIGGSNVDVLQKTCC